MESESPGTTPGTYYYAAGEEAERGGGMMGEEGGGGGGGGETVLVVEHKSLRSFTTNDEYLYAMKEDLADWFAFLYKVPVDAETFFAILETGVLLCRHANEVQHFFKQRAKQLKQQQGTTTTTAADTSTALAMRSYFIRNLPENELQQPVQCRTEVAPGTFQSRDNVSNFIAWCRQLGIPDVLRFETDDLVLRKNEKSVILCLLELARVGAKLGMPAPTLVRMEQEIEQELAMEQETGDDGGGGGGDGDGGGGEEDGCRRRSEEEVDVVVSPPSPPKPQILTCDMKSLDELVRDLVGQCTCPVQFPMVKEGEGKYRIGDSRTLIFVRVLRNHVMVRVGGGWDTLENYLNKHDPCRCHYKGHRGAGSGAVTPARHQILRHSSTTALIASRGVSTPNPSPSTGSTHHPHHTRLNHTTTTPRGGKTTPSPSPSSGQGACLKGSHSEHTTFVKGPSPVRSTLPTSHSFHKGRSPSPSTGAGGYHADFLSPGRATTTPSSSSSQGLVGILKHSPSSSSNYYSNPARSASPEFREGGGASRIPTSASSQSFKDSKDPRTMRESRESSVGRSLDSVRDSRSSSPSSSLSSSSMRQAEDRPRPSQLPQYQRCKSPSPGVGVGGDPRCVSPAVSGNRSLLPRAVGCGGGGGGSGSSGIPRPMSPAVTSSATNTPGGRRPASSLSKEQRSKRI